MKQQDLPFVSVVTPAYNESKRIPILLNDLLSQTYPRDKYEIILVDNGSTDSTVEEARRHPVAVLEERSVKSSYAARRL